MSNEVSELCHRKKSGTKKIINMQTKKKKVKNNDLLTHPI